MIQITSQVHEFSHFSSPYPFPCPAEEGEGASGSVLLSSWLGINNHTAKATRREMGVHGEDLRQREGAEAEQWLGIILFDDNKPFIASFQLYYLTIY